MGNTQQLYGRLDMVMLDRHDKIYGSLGMHDSYLLNTVTGNPLTLAHSREGKMGDEVTDCKIYGWSKQETTTGAQLWKFGDIKFLAVAVKKLSTSLKKRKYTITADVESTDTDSKSCLMSIGGKNISFPRGKGVSVTFEPIREITEIYVYASDDYENSQGDTVSFKNVMLNAGDTALPYEPYTGGQPSPSPEYPQEIESAGSDGKIGIEVRGKNLMDFTKAPDVSDIYQGWKIPKKDYESVTVTLFDNDVTVDISGIYFGFTMKGTNESDGYIWMVDNGRIKKREFNSNFGYLSICPKNSMKTFLQRFKILVEIGTIPTAYEPYHEPQSLSIKTPTGLPAIPVDTDGNYTDANGQQWIADYVDLKLGKLYKKVTRLNLKDVDVTNIVHGFHLNGNGYLSFSIKNVDKEQIPISNRYKGSIWTTKSGYVYAPNSNSIVLVDDRFADKQTAIKLVQDTYVIYVLTSQIETDLTPEEIQAYKNLVTYAGTTIVENDVECYMECTYKASGNE